ncbi:hypothetical protein AB0O31_02165 [Kitasatospora cineracea]|uniref:hypothetical protein n=1 Tax=Kitasatospora cineracea TaxID=88074 RepID=UPI003440EF80
MPRKGPDETTSGYWASGTNGSDLLGATLNANTVVRSGGNGYGQGQPALHVGNGGDGQNAGVVDHVSVTGNTVLDALYDVVGLSASTNTAMRDNTVTAPGHNGFVVAPPFYPAPTGSAALTGNTVTGLSAPGATAYRNNSPAFTVTANGNSWGSGTGNPEAPYGGSPAAVPVTLPAGRQVLTLVQDTGGWNLNSMAFHDTSAPPPPARRFSAAARG